MGALGHLRVHHQAAHQAAITGRTPDGEPIKGDYKFTDEFPMADRLRGERRVLHPHLRGAAARRVQPGVRPRSRRCSGCALGRAAGASTTSPTGWDVADAYGVLATSTTPTTFLKAVAEQRRRRDSRSSSPTRTVSSSPSSRELPDARRARAALRGVPAKLRDRVRARRAVKFTLKDYQAAGRRRRPPEPEARARRTTRIRASARSRRSR